MRKTENIFQTKLMIDEKREKDLLFINKDIFFKINVLYQYK